MPLAPLLNSLTAIELPRGSEWIMRLVDCGYELSSEREGFGIQLLTAEPKT